MKESKGLKEYDLTSDLTVIALIFIMIVASIPYFETVYANYNKEKKIYHLSNKYQVAKEVVVDLDKENQDLKNENLKLKQDLKEVEVLIQIKEELRSYTTREKAVALGVGFSESNWNPNVVHKVTGKGYNYSNMCGNMPWYWDDFLIERNVDPNGIAACIEIYKFYKDKHGTRYAAIKEYKGIEQNIHIITKTEKMIDKAYKILKANNL